MGGGSGHYSKYTQQVSFREPGQSVRPSALCFHSLSGAFLTNFLQTWYKS